VLRGFIAKLSLVERLVDWFLALHLEQFQFGLMSQDRRKVKLYTFDRSFVVMTEMKEIFFGCAKKKLCFESLFMLTLSV
jgi:hypothetical protein